MRIVTIILCFYTGLVYGQSCVGPLDVTMQGSSTGDALELMTTAQDIYCADASDGSIAVDVSGGSPQYIYAWSNGETSGDQENLAEGQYTVTVTDSKGCEKIKMIDVSIVDPKADAIDLTMVNSCGACTIADGNKSFIYNADGDYLVELQDVTNGNAIEDVDVCVAFDATTQVCEDAPLLTRHWNIEATNTETIVRLYFTQSEVEALATAAGYENLTDFASSGDFCIKKYDGGQENCNDHTSMITIENCTLVLYDPVKMIWYTEVTVTAFSTFYATVCAKAPLPVDLVHFSGEWKLDNSELTWASENEYLDKYIIERSYDGTTFSVVDEVIANNELSNTYKYNDYTRDIQQSDHYYRLKMLDYDGTFKYSHIIRLENKSDVGIVVTPSTALGQITFTTPSDRAIDFSYGIYDITGKLIRSNSSTISSHDRYVERMSDLNEQVFILQVYDTTNNRSRTYKFLNVR